MKVITEAISIFRDGDAPDLTLVMGGYRLALTVEEAQMLVSTLRSALSEVPGGRSDGAAAEALRGSNSAAMPSVDNGSILAKVTEQVISWAKIADASQRK